MAIEYDTVVDIGYSFRTAASGLAGKRGVVRGAIDRSSVRYAVAIDGEVNLVDEADMIDTGLKSDPAEHYSGETIVVSPERWEGPNG